MLVSTTEGFHLTCISFPTFNSSFPSTEIGFPFTFHHHCFQPFGCLLQPVPVSRPGSLGMRFPPEEQRTNSSPHQTGFCSLAGISVIQNKQTFCKWLFHHLRYGCMIQVSSRSEEPPRQKALINRSKTKSLSRTDCVCSSRPGRITRDGGSMSEMASRGVR